MEIKINKELFTDEEILNDMLYTEKHSADNYNRFAYECRELNLQDTVLSILCEEHKIHFELFKEMKKRGWYHTQNVESSKIQEIKQKYTLSK